MPTKISTLFSLLCVLVIVGFVNAQNSKLTRRTALSNLKLCTSDPRKDSSVCEDSAGFLEKLYETGDRALLTPLFNARLKSDGALSEALGPFYADVLLKHTTFFLTTLSRWPSRDQKVISMLAVSADGGGNPEPWNRRIKSRLRGFVAHNNGLAPTARILLRELDAFLVENR